MALAKIQKIQLIGSKKHKAKILETLQNAGVLEVIEKAEAEIVPQDDKKFQETELKYANLDFAINLLAPYTKKRSMFAGPLMLTLEEIEAKSKDFDYAKVIEECSEIEDKSVKAKNRITAIENQLQEYNPWRALEIDLGNLKGSQSSAILIGTVKTIQFKELIEKLHQLSDLVSSDIVHRDNVETYITIIFSRELEAEIRQVLMEFKFTEANLPETKGRLEDYIKKLREDLAKQKKALKDIETELRELAVHSENLQIVHDFYGWQLEKLEAEKKFLQTAHNFIITGWMPSKSLESVKAALSKETEQYEIFEIQPEENENPPVIMTNSSFLSPFEAVSKIYGLPKHDEMDPTPYLAAYFILFFALCLTDAGYGLLMFIIMALALKLFKLPEGIYKLVKLLMYGGVVTFFIGALFGGWFGLTPDQVPEALTYINASGEKMFLFQKINAINSPITVLILSVVLGYLQILMGVTMKFLHDFKNSDKKAAILDTGTWVFMLIGIGYFIAGTALKLPEVAQMVAKYWVYLATVLLIVTQGRDKSNIFGKLISGVLSLYGLVGYMSDILSYSRLLALGLATAIIGLAVNIVADLASGLPFIGWLLMIIVFIGGHIFNLLINALGAFIHSGRLQFVEFFTKFMEGGGDEFKPFSKKTKYILIKS